MGCYHTGMADWPVMLRLEGRKAVIVGGGSVALRRAVSLCQCGAQVTVIAPQVEPQIQTLAVKTLQREYRKGDLDGTFLVVIATDDAALNQRIDDDARSRHVLVNRADAPQQGDLSVMAHQRLGPVTVGVSTSGISAKAAATIRDQLLATMDQDWVALLQTAEPYRERVQRQVPDADRRQAALVRLTDEQAMAVFKKKGIYGLSNYCEQVIKEAGVA